jgi:hypothetical protein
MLGATSHTLVLLLLHCYRLPAAHPQSLCTSPVQQYSACIDQSHSSST